MSDYTTERWHKLLVDACAAEPRGIAGVAERLGVSRTQVSLVVSGKYAKPGRIVASVIAQYDRRICPHDGQEKQPVQCQRVALRPRPHGFPDAETLWLACQSCPHAPKEAPVGGKPKSGGQ